MVKTVIECIVVLVFFSTVLIIVAQTYMSLGEWIWDYLYDNGQEWIRHSHGWKRYFFDDMISDAKFGWSFLFEFLKVFTWPIFLPMCFLAWVIYATVMTIIVRREIDKDGYEREDYKCSKRKKESK